MDVDVFNAYAKRREPIVAAVEGRVTIIHEKNRDQWDYLTSGSPRSWNGGLVVLCVALVSSITFQSH